MSKIVVYAKDASRPVGPYSQAILSNGMLFISGQISINPDTGDVFLGDIKTQTRMALTNMKAVLNAGGCDFEDVVKTTIFITDISKFGEANEVYKEYFVKEPPARSCVGVANLPKGVGVEIEAIAIKQ